LKQHPFELRLITFEVLRRSNGHNAVNMQGSKQFFSLTRE
jgi:hypothetical protein